jgi:hypothetical protein
MLTAQSHITAASRTVLDAPDPAFCASSSTSAIRAVRRERVPPLSVVMDARSVRVAVVPFGVHWQSKRRGVRCGVMWRWPALGVVGRQRRHLSVPLVARRSSTPSRPVLLRGGDASG